MWDHRTRGVFGVVNYGSQLANLLFEIWRLKFLNIWRNPYGVKKFYNTFHPSSFPDPKDPYLKECYELIDAQTEHDVKEVLEIFDLNLTEYSLWRKGLLRLLMKDEGDQYKFEWSENLFDELAYNLLIDKRRSCAIELHYLTEDFPGRFLLSDRSYYYGIDSGEPSLSFSFNLTGQIAMKFGSLEPSELFTKMVKEDPRLAECPQEVIDGSASQIAEQLQFRVIINNEDEVKSFNEKAIFQAKGSVFCCQKLVLGSTVLPPPKKRRYKIR